MFLSLLVSNLLSTLSQEFVTFVRLLHSAVPVNSVELNTETLGEVVLETKLLRGWLQILELVSTCKSFDDTKDSMNFSSREYLFQDLNHFKIIFPCLLKG